MRDDRCIDERLGDMWDDPYPYGYYDGADDDDDELADYADELADYARRLAAMARAAKHVCDGGGNDA